MGESNYKPILKEDKIDLLALVSTLKLGKKIIIKSVLFFFLIGLFVAVFSEKEYTSSTTFVPQVSDSKIGGGLGGLAAMAGINLGGVNSSSEIAPSLYPQIMESALFQLELLKTPLTIEGESKKVSFENYYLNIYRLSFLDKIKKYTIGLPGVLIACFTESLATERKERFIDSGDVFTMSNLVFISLEQNKLIERLKNQLFLEVKDEVGCIVISGKMPSAIASAELVMNTQQLLQNFIIEFKIKKSKEKLVFIKERYKNVEGKFIDVQLRLAKFEDNNKYVNTAMSKIELQSMQDEYNLVYSVYTELAKQLESQYLQVTEDTPVFTVLQDAVVPLKKSNPKRVMILIIYIIFGFVFGIAIIIGKHISLVIKEKNI